MKFKKVLKRKSILFAFIALIVSVQSMFAQDALTSVRYTVKNFRLSNNQKVISYDVYLKDIDNNHSIAVPVFTFRLMVPLADLGENAKTVTVTNGTNELGAANATMSISDKYWLMKFTQETIALKYADALVLSNVGDGTLVGTFNIANKDGSSFSSTQPFHAIYSGTRIKTKSTVSILKPETIHLANNSTTPLPEFSTIGLGTHYLKTITALDNLENGYMVPFPNPTTKGFNINVGENSCILNIFDIKGAKLITQNISGDNYIDISSFEKGVYLVEANGICTKLIKK